MATFVQKLEKIVQHHFNSWNSTLLSPSENDYKDRTGTQIPFAYSLTPRHTYLQTESIRPTTHKSIETYSETHTDRKRDRQRVTEALFQNHTESEAKTHTDSETH